MEKLCDYITALGQVYNRMEVLIGTTRMKLKSGASTISEDDLTKEQFDEIKALVKKEDEIKYSMTHNSFKFSESAIYNCPNGREIALWMDK